MYTCTGLPRCTYVFLDSNTYMHTYLHVHIHVKAFLDALRCSWTVTHTHIHNLHTYIPTCTHPSSMHCGVPEQPRQALRLPPTHTHTYTQIYIYIHTHIHTYTGLPRCTAVFLNSLGKLYDCHQHTPGVQTGGLYIPSLSVYVYPEVEGYVHARMYVCVCVLMYVYRP